MPTWQFTLETGPLTTHQVDALEIGVPGSAVTLSAYRDGMVQATVECETIQMAFAMARNDLSDITGQRPARIVALRGELEGSVADVVFRAAERLRIDAAEVLLEHLALVWYREAREMAICGARDEQHYGIDGNPKRALIVKPVPGNEMASTEVMMTWEAIYSAAKGYLDGHTVDGSAPRVIADPHLSAESRDEEI